MCELQFFCTYDSKWWTLTSRAETRVVLSELITWYWVHPKFSHSLQQINTFQRFLYFCQLWPPTLNYNENYREFGWDRFCLSCISLQGAEDVTDRSSVSYCSWEQHFSQEKMTSQNIFSHFITRCQTQTLKSSCIKLLHDSTRMESSIETVTVKTEQLRGTWVCLELHGQVNMDNLHYGLLLRMHCWELYEKFYWDL